MDVLVGQLWSAVRFHVWNLEAVAVETAGDRDLTRLNRIEKAARKLAPGLSRGFC